MLSNQKAQVSTHETPMLSGKGKYDTDTNGELGSLSFNDLLDMADTPQNIDKSDALWCIPTTEKVRANCRAKYSDNDPTMAGLWFDIDTGNVEIIELSDAILAIVGFVNHLVYSSKSSTPDNRKYRVFIPLERLISRTNYRIISKHINERLCAAGIEPDRANEKPFQVFYLPNKGDSYDCVYDAEAENLDAIERFQNVIDEQTIRDTEAKEATQARIAESKAKREQRATDGFDSPIAAFNASYEVEDILLRAGYEQQGSTFKHPNSESGSFSASVKESRVHSLSSKDPLFTGGFGGGAHDAFSAFCILFHKGNRDAAIKDAGDNWLSISGEPWNRVKQREYATKNSTSNKSKFEGIAITGSALDCLKGFSATGSSDAMKKKMLNDVFVLEGLAIRGQWTTFYAAPNSGKTLIILKLLCEQVKTNNEIKGKNVFYVNIDDTYKGGVEKTVIAEEYGFEMIVGSENGFKASILTDLLDRTIQEGQAMGVIIILDTLKKFTDLMDKKLSSEFGVLAREFTQAGGTIIALAHVNKNKGTDGKSVHAGTSDIKDDCDCSYIIERVDEKELHGITTHTVEFHNVKQRGDVKSKVAFTYKRNEGQTYRELFESVRKVDDQQLSDIRKLNAVKNEQEKHAGIISAIEESIEQGITLKTPLVDAVYEATAETKTTILKVLMRWTGTRKQDGHLWQEIKGLKNAKKYQLLPKENPLSIITNRDRMNGI